MLRRFDTDRDVVALSIADELSSDDVRAAMHAVDTALAQPGPVHLFVEIGRLQHVDRDALREGLAHGIQYLSNLKRFGRIAIVSDQAWIRAMSRVESALLPHVGYEVFTPDQRDHAIAWVKGEEPRPHPPAFRRLDARQPNVFAFEINGKIDREEIRSFLDVLDAATRSAKPIRILGRIRDIRGFDPALIGDRRYIELKLRLASHVERYAIVGGPAWLRSLVMTLDPFFRMDLRHFEEEEEAAAWRWLGESATGQAADAPAPLSAEI